MADDTKAEVIAPTTGTDTTSGLQQKSAEAAATIAQDEDMSDVEEVWMGEEEPDIERTIRKAHMRTKQASRWNVDIHFRVKKLEKTLQEITGEDLVQSSAHFRAEKGPTHEPIIKRMTWDEFKPPRALVRATDSASEKHPLRLDTRKRWVLEVLERETEQVERTPTNKPASSSTQDYTGDGADTGAGQQFEHSALSGASSKAPARLRIRSWALLAHLNDISKDELNTKPGKMVFLRPFKFFCVYEDEIRARHAELEKKYAAELGAVPTVESEDKSQAKPTLNRRHNSKASIDSPDTSQGEKESPKALLHFRLLIKFLDEDLQQLFKFRRSLAAKEVKKISFSELWHLFRHDQEVFVPKNEKQSHGIYRVYKFTGGRHTFRSNYGQPIHPISEELGPGSWSNAFAVQCWSLKFDGTVHRPQLKTFGIRPYEGEKEITALPVYPMDFHPEREEVCRTYEAAGRTFLSFCQKKGIYRRYTGPNLDEGSRNEHINSEVVVDFEQAYLDGYEKPVAIDFDENVISNDYREVDEHVPGNSHCKDEGCCTADVFHPDFLIDNDLLEKHFKHGYDSPVLEPRTEIETDEDRKLLPSQVYGFILKKQKWAILSIASSSLREVESLNFWKDLVLGRETKDLVEAQVKQHLRKADDEKKGGPDARFGEFISGKGRSLVILLHGPPGVGKTSTAECIADHVKKPLYSLTSGNLGVDPDTVEQKLENHFNLAAKWGCILLLDEADVFLQQRKHTQLNINAIVSVFLRQLEYYTGVLFLTTNRLGDIDRAFKSRIHIAIEYKRFKRSTTIKVYELCLRRLRQQYESRNRDLQIKEDKIIAWAKKQYEGNRWNGREIFNSCQTAIALAEWEFEEGKTKKLSLREKHFEKVAEASRGFERYLNDLRDEEGREAWRQRTRMDEDFRGSVAQGSFLTTPTPAEKKSKRKPASDEDEDDDDDGNESSEGEKKSRKRGRGKKKGSDEDSDGSDSG